MIQKNSNATVCHNFKFQLTNRFESLALDFNNEGTVESFLNTLKEAYNQRTLEMLGHKKYPKIHGYPIRHGSSLKSIKN